MGPRPSAFRIRPVEHPGAEVQAVLEKTLLLDDGRPANIFGVLAHHPKLLKRFNVLGGLFLANGLVPPREREIVILRVGWQCRAVYEFGQHTVIGRRCGLTNAEIAALAQPAADHPWTPTERALIAMTDEICADNCVSDGTWAALRDRWNDAELCELVMLAGMYRMVSGFLNTMGVELDGGIPGWPDGVEADAG